MNETKEEVVKHHPPPLTKRKSGRWAPSVSKVLSLANPSLYRLFASTDVFLTWRNWLNIIDQITGPRHSGRWHDRRDHHRRHRSLRGFDSCLFHDDDGLALSNAVPQLAVVAGLLMGTACGLVNGLLITRAKLPPFIATLTMMSIGRGLANIITEGRQIVGYRSGSPVFLRCVISDLSR